MRTVFTAAVALTLLTGAGDTIPSRASRPADSVAKSRAVSETWNLRAVAPDGRQCSTRRAREGLSEGVGFLEQTVPDT